MVEKFRSERESASAAASSFPVGERWAYLREENSSRSEW